VVVSSTTTKKGKNALCYVPHGKIRVKRVYYTDDYDEKLSELTSKLESEGFIVQVS
jgi:hypothetical protein